ncbi:acyl-CoA thioesterase [Paracoccus rhizosphaerae]|uniref:Acyl-CoA thioesterase n=1 Tax=Paracoccus rhizosphaerae TaxID=1133347 RepID=A0ABV6CP18_9RHOB|nr:thioesterase family protein [Paracoccus rhizosphaerae]
MTFILRRQVEFNHCDPAGIVFYPRYFEMISAVTERFFADGVGVSWAEMQQTGFGTPMGHIDTRFLAPSRLGDWLSFALEVREIGRSSVTVAIAGTCEAEARFDCTATMIHAHPSDAASAPWPDTLRRAMTRYAHQPSEA